MSTLRVANLETPDGNLYLSSSGGQDISIHGNITVQSITRSGGSSSDFLKADGSVDSTVYITANSPGLIGVPTAPTAEAGTKTTQIATTEFVSQAVNSSIAMIIALG